MKKAFGGVRNAVGSLVEPAEDPRTIRADTRQPHLESLGQVQNARYEVDLALERLESLSQKARGSLSTIEQQVDEGATSQRFSDELKREVAVEIASIERQEEHLRRQQEVLLMAERRLVAGIRRGAVTRQLKGATSTSTQASQAADTALREAGTDMRRLDAVINRARAATERLEDQGKAIDKMAVRGASRPDRAQSGLTREQRIIAGFEDMQSEDHGPELRRLAEQGGKITGRLLAEYQQLDLAIRRHQSDPQTPGSRLAISAARTFRGGLEHASSALEELTRLSFESDLESAARTRPAAEQLALAGQAESAIYRTRLEFVALIKGDADTTPEAVFEALEQPAPAKAN
ncbi:MAG: hypothetical protein QF357_03935 [Dehalococcoidia bacterium]|jgi:hypothetical protein|nr:hypothetical protein [Dehalococcoidia bacterium]